MSKTHMLLPSATVYRWLSEAAIPSSRMCWSWACHPTKWNIQYESIRENGFQSQIVVPGNRLQRPLSARTLASYSSSSSPSFSRLALRTPNPRPLDTTTTSTTETETSSWDEESPTEIDGELAPYYSPYKPKRQWPPDMSKLSSKHQFRLERKYRRRAALKYARPKWVKVTKLAQWATITFVLVYTVLFLEWDSKDNPLKEFRQEFFTTFNSIFHPPTPPARRADNHPRS